ncbi:MAG: C39 family peptidase [Bacteroidaceae bacterium]|nr:C39 family peptidase [Bacteroidaceae bacterium]
MNAKPKKRTLYTASPVAGYVIYKFFKEGHFSKLDETIENDADAPFSDHGSQAPSSASMPMPNGGPREITPADTISGEPAVNIAFDPQVYQYYDDTCAIQSQRIILEKFGIEKSQEELIQIAKDNGWYTEGYGTPMESVGRILDYFGIDATGTTGNNIFNLSNELAQGHYIIVGVDGMELVNPDVENHDMDIYTGGEANHALVVVGIDTTDPDNPQVIVTDPGTGNVQMAYPADQFVDAWKDSNCFMVSTDQSPQEYSGEDFQGLTSFAGIPTHQLEEVAGFDMNLNESTLDEFSSFYHDFLDHPESLDDLVEKYDDLFTHDDDEDLSL